MVVYRHRRASERFSTGSYHLCLECHPGHCIYLSVDFAMSLTRRRRDHTCDSSSSCGPIASITDLVSAGAPGHRGTKSQTSHAEGFRATSCQKNRPLCCQNVGQ